MEATEADACAVCLAKPPRIGRTRAAVGYCDLTRALAIQPQHGRKVAIAAAVAGKTGSLVDDVLTTGSTPDAYARALQRAGPSHVELITWARVVRPLQLMR